ncbi:MAG: M23 family metallopeptidase [Candidatus Pacebacteria bacterium]|nr:M23 family metallopeptidase [Candidatus Paceibacterota bacterium]
MAQKLVFAVLLGFLLTPSVANAGVFSFVSGFFDDAEKIMTENCEGINSQNMALLKAAVSYNSTSSIGGGTINIVKGSFLSYETGPVGTMVNVEKKPNSYRIATYIVREGDTLGQIAKMFDVSTGTIIWANDIKRGDLIREGQILSILPINGIRHMVVKGETLQGLVKKYGGDVNEILQYNNLPNGYVLAIGAVIIIPDGEAPLPSYSSKTIAAKSKVRGTGGPEYAGYYIRPVVGGRISQGLHGYNAIDFAVPLGTPILAAASGDVIISKDNGYWNGGYGNYIVIKHNNGTQTLYSHNSKNIVWPGYHVVQGQVIGYIGSTGRSTGPHVHFEVRGAQNPWGVTGAR